ncbi:peptide deformylase [Candidatus Annandia pinicola]|uniref:peptide deformylase n=1 Tax=Candidatus Annandia pinicola TaxID=1345117 RepID=UPI001D003D61|nr:peptide deformylase [Candidatus Annandia pinicola]UDG80473.1 Peptide deformylase [Candidatus Annandia pinicola]
MLISNLLYYPDKRLRLNSKKIKIFGEKNNYLIKNMLKIMYDNVGIGLAANQINVQKQIIVIDISNDHNKPLILINPKFIYKNNLSHNHEGCISIPNYMNSIPRFKIIIIEAYDQYGKLFRLKASNLLSFCIQHEMDHLIGKLIIDYLPFYKIETIKNKYLKLKKNTIIRSF